MKKGLKIGAASLAALLVFGAAGCGKDDKLSKLPAPRLEETKTGEKCVSNNYALACSSITKDNLEKYLGRSDVTYIDLRPYSEILSSGGMIEGFVHIDYARDFYDSKGDGTDQLFNKDYTPRFADSVKILEELFPKDRTYFFMCAGGGRTQNMMKIMAMNGWDENRLYNVGGWNNFSDAKFDEYKVTVSGTPIAYKVGVDTETDGGHTYTTTVKVTTDNDGKITNVFVVGNGEYTATPGGEWTPETWVTERFEYADQLVGKTLTDINTMLGQNGASGNDVVTGATKTSNRVLRAVKNALTPAA